MEGLKPIKINSMGEVIGGQLGGTVGMVISADWEEKKITIRVDSTTTITTEWINIKQI